MNGIDSTVRVHVLVYVRDVFMLSASIFEAKVCFSVYYRSNDEFLDVFQREYVQFILLF